MKTRLKNARAHHAPDRAPGFAVDVRNGETKTKLDLSFGDLPPGFAYNRLNFDPVKFPWPLADGSVEEAYSAFMLNRVPGRDRLAFMDELWRVLVPAGKATIIVPYWTSYRAIQDPSSEWPPFAEQSFLYFNKAWRAANRIYPEAKCDFDFVYGYSLAQETILRTDDTRAFWIKHYTNAILDLQVTLSRR